MQHTSRLLTRSKPYSRSSSIKSRLTQHSKRITEESETESASKQAKPFTLHCALLFVVLIYSFIAGMIFRWLESEHLENKHQMEWQKKLVCVHQVFDNATALSYRNYKPINSTLEEIIHCFVAKMDAKSTWGPLTAAFYGFGIATTLGYNYLHPETIAGRMFCIVYGICSIPITMIIVANVGQYLHQFAGSMKKNIEVRSKRRRASKAHLTEEDIPDASVTVASLGLLLFFLLYVSMGALFLPLLNGEMDFWNGLYVNFICLTAIDGFGHLVPKNLAYWPITFFYILIGLAITTIAIDIGSQFMKKLHHLGQKVRNVASTKIWFGGKTLKVRDLLHAVGKKCGIDPTVIDNLDLENVVEQTIAMNEGRELPINNNDDVEKISMKIPKRSTSTLQKDENDNTRPPSEACPLLYQNSVKSRTTSKASKTNSLQADFIIQNPTVETLSDRTTSIEMNIPPFSNDSEFIAIDMDLPDFIDEPTITFENPLMATRFDPIVIPPSPTIANPNDLNSGFPVMIFEDSEAIQQARQIAVNEEPRRFREKRERYGRDPNRLYETYKEEWDRLERLSDRRLGPRRKSVLASTFSTHSSISSISDTEEMKNRK